jgi:site-specific recombinase XerD
MSSPDTFELFKKSLSGRDPKTIKAYSLSLLGFISWLEKQPDGSPFEPAKITTTAVNSYLDYLVANRRSPHTQRLALSALRRYCNWAVGEGVLPNNPARQVPLPSVMQMAPRELSSEQRYALKTQVEKERSPRLSAVFALGYWTGLRISEIAELRLEDVTINQRSGYIRVVNSKGGKSRQLDLHNESRRAISGYLTTNERDPDSQYLFTSQRAAWLRQQEKPDHLSTRGIGYLWEKMKANAPFEFHELIKDITMHDLRHDFAHRARQSGWNLEEIAVYLGHQTKSGTPAIATTVRYTLPSRKQLKRRLKMLAG